MEIKNTVRYGLYHLTKKVMLTAHETSNDGGDFCNETTCTLEDYSYNDISPWSVATAKHAEWVRHNSTQWYNSCNETPRHFFEPEELRVAEIVSIIKIIPSPELPTLEEAYAEELQKNPKYLDAHESIDPLHIPFYQISNLLMDKSQE